MEIFIAHRHAQFRSRALHRCSVISRNATSTVTSRNKLTATLNTESVARRLFRSAFFKMNRADGHKGEMTNDG